VLELASPVVEKTPFADGVVVGAGPPSPASGKPRSIRSQPITSGTNPSDRTQVKPKTKLDGMSWNGDAIGPGAGIQATSAHPGRLVIPACHRFICSDDYGATWIVYQPRTTTGDAMEQTSESTVLELADGRLYRNDRTPRTLWETAKRRWVTAGTIEDGFTPFAPVDCLLDRFNEGSTMRPGPARLESATYRAGGYSGIAKTAA
jgi:hypothetical protein